MLKFCSLPSAPITPQRHQIFYDGFHPACYKCYKLCSPDRSWNVEGMGYTSCRNFRTKEGWEHPCRTPWRSCGSTWWQRNTLWTLHCPLLNRLNIFNIQISPFLLITESLGLEWISGDHPVQLPAKAGPPGTGGTGMHPGGFGMSLERETPWNPWTACMDSPAREQSSAYLGWLFWGIIGIGWRVTPMLLVDLTLTWWERIRLLKGKPLDETEGWVTQHPKISTELSLLLEEPRQSPGKFL